MLSQQTPTDDWAIVVGIQYYPGLVVKIGSEGLKGPVNDAQEFISWVTAAPPLGAGVRPERVLKLVQAPPAASAGRQMPLIAAIENAKPDLPAFWDALKQIDIAAEQNSELLIGEKAGRRLYIYLAGHGIEPLAGGPALLMANCSVTNFVRHIQGRVYADWYFHAAFFDEVLLFMDCCRDNTWTTSPMPIDKPPKFGNIMGLKYFYAFGTKWDRRSRECDFNGTTHGIFTMALLDGLRGGASDQFTKKVTVGSLKDYLRWRMANVACAQVSGLAPQIPDFEPEDAKFVIVENVPPKLYPVKVPLPADAVGKPFEIQTNSAQFPMPQSVFKDQAVPAQLSLELARGIYWGEFTQADGEIGRSIFEVPSPSDIHN